MIQADEYEDFETAVRRNGYDIKDFEVTEHETAETVTNGRPRPKEVTVKRHSTSASSTYRTDILTRWYLDFEGDLKAGVFDH